MRIIVNILANSAAIKTAAYLIPGFIFRGNWQDLLLAGAVLGIINSIIRPLVKLLTFPFILLTLGLFTLIINIVLLFFVADLIPGLAIHGFWAACGGVIIISLVNHFVLSLFKPNSKED